MTDAQLLLLADTVLVIHFAIAAFNVFSLPVIWIGALLKKRFVHNPWFRLTHLGIMAFVVEETLMGRLCPLTIWEGDLRRAAGAGGPGDGQASIPRLLGDLLFSQYDDTTYMIVYSLFFAAIVGTVLLVPIRFKRRRNREKMS